MKNKIIKVSKILLTLILGVSLLLSTVNAKDTKVKGNLPAASVGSSLSKVSDEGGKKGDAYRMMVNNINLPMNRTGVIAEVSLPDPLQNNNETAGGFYDGVVFLFAAGFFMGGVQDGKIWALGQAAASRVGDVITGTYESGQNDPRAVMYVLKKSDGDFHQSWLDWKDAVDLGAKFYDGDGDGEYNPLDLNGNGAWDPDEDRPDLIGDETVWCVFNDGLDPALRRFTAANLRGLEFRQTVFGFASKGSLGNILFVRYEILNTGLYHEQLDSVYFGVWADADVGDYENDLVGCDVSLNAGFTYDNEVDAEYGNSPCFLIDFFQGPVSSVPGETFVDTDGDGIYTDGVDTPLDTAYLVHGQVRGVEELPGAKNLGLSSFMHYIQSHQLIGDPDNEIEAYNYLRGLDRFGDVLDPCTWGFGDVRGGVNCATVDNRFWYSGDPVTDVGWICNFNADQRQMSNTGPFTLKAGEPLEIVAAYVVGRASTSIESVNEAKKIDNFAQFIYDGNFKTAPPPPVPQVTIKTEDNAIELIWETPNQVNFNEVAYDDAGNIVYDVRFEGYEVFMYNSASTAEREGGRTNAIRIASYDLENDIGNIIIEDGGTGERITEYYKGIQLDPAIYNDPVTGRIRLRIENDPFTNTPLIKGKPYYIGISAYGVNHTVLQKLDPDKPADDKYLIPATAFIGVTATIPSILGPGPGITPGSNELTPFRSGVALEQLAGATEAEVNYSVFVRSAVKNHPYEVTFFKDSLSAKYSQYWRVTNKTTGEVVLDSMKAYDMTNPTYLADGVMLNIEWVKPHIETETADAAASTWLASEKTGGFHGALYAGGDADTLMIAQFINNTNRSKITTFDKTRRIELRFGQPSMAYRYVKRATSLRYLTPDPSDPEQGARFVQVPFQAWVNDDKYGEERRLAVAYLEKLPRADDSLTFNDEKWNPGTNLKESTEYIVIFNSDYIELSESNYNVVYTGTGTGTAQAKFADVGNGYRINVNDPEFPITPAQENIAKSPWFDALFLAALETKTDDPNFNPTGTYTINVNYPITSADKFTYTPSINLTQKEEEERFAKVNVYPNPLFGYNSLTSHGGRPDEPFVTFTNLPEVVTVKIYTLSGNLVRTLRTEDKSSQTSPYLRWDLKNDDGLRVASGMYLAIVSSQGLGEKVLKFSIIMPQKQIQRF